MIYSKISLSDSDFSQKILRKYQKGKLKFLNFPFMVFGKNLEHILPQKFNINIRLQLHFHNQRIINYIINKSMKEWVSGIEKIFTELIYRPDILKIIRNNKKSITFQHETISGFPLSIYKSAPGQSKSSIIFPNFLFNASSPDVNNAVYNESACSYSLSNQIVRRFLMNSGSISAGKTRNNMLSSRNTLSEAALKNQNLIYSNNIRNIHSIISGLKLKSEQYISYNKENIERNSGQIDHSSFLLSYGNLFLNNKIFQNPVLYQPNITLSSAALKNKNLIYSNNVRNIHSILSGLKLKSEQYISYNKENIERNSGQVDHSSYLLSNKNLFLNNKIIQNAALYQPNITLSDEALKNKNLIYSNNIRNIHSIMSGPKLKSEQYISYSKENIQRNSGHVDHSSYLLSYRNLFLNNKIIQNAALYPLNITLSDVALKNQNLNIVLRRKYDKKQLTETNSQLNHELLQTKNPKTILLDFETTGKYYPTKNEYFGGNNLFENNHSKFSITFIQPVIKKETIKNPSNSFSSISLQRRDVQNNDSFYFQNHRQMDQKIEQIKKISQEAKEIVSKKILLDSSVKAEIQPEIDIRRLSDKVYKMIEYNLKIEKERRGYL